MRKKTLTEKRNHELEENTTIRQLCIQKNSRFNSPTSSYILFGITSTSSNLGTEKFYEYLIIYN